MLIEDVRSALVVFAHCDDAEWMFGGTVARLVSQGARVDYVVCTDGSSGGIDMSVTDAELAATRAGEQRGAAAVLGVTEVVFLGHADSQLRVTPELKRDLVRQIRRFRPDLLLTMTPSRPLDVPIDWSHSDHMAAGEAALQAVYPEALMPRIYPELLAEGLEPHAVREAWVPALADADLYVDVTAVAETKMDAVWCHGSQNGEANGDRGWMFEHHIAPPLREAGLRIGCRYAERFRRIPIRP
ncbi:PIG-L deacetylase family protein [uncultured Friedmanniella sp.]|uniref:PIG-L deacetylase family protein n=1 Tax=uncultured Friedmanniella sp. TaxID=335381 RepID=UPI0035CAADBA